MAERHIHAKSDKKCQLSTGFICESDRINPGELLLSIALFRFIRYAKCKVFSGLKKNVKSWQDYLLNL